MIKNVPINDFYYRYVDEENRKYSLFDFNNISCYFIL